MPKDVLRIGVLALCALEAAAVVVVLIGAFTVRTDLAGEGMAHAYALVILFVWLLFAAPAAALAWFRRWLWVALALALAPAVLIGLVMV
jgi:hypothetical protein